MATRYKLYADSRSGNCFKIKWTADHLGFALEWIETDIIAGETRTDEFLTINPFGQVPTLLVEDNGQRRALTQSNAIVLYFAEKAGDISFLPSDPITRVKVYQWLFWEQNSHEPYIAGRRFRRSILKQAPEEIDKEWLPRGRAALQHMENALRDQNFLVGSNLTAADLVVFPYTRFAHEGEFNLSDYPKVQQWIARIEKNLNLNPVTES